MSNTNPTNNTEPAVYQAELVLPPDRTSSVKYVLLGCAGAVALFVLVLGIIGWIAYKKIVTGADAAGTLGNVRVIDQESKRRMTAMRFTTAQKLQPSKTLKELEQAII